MANKKNTIIEATIWLMTLLIMAVVFTLHERELQKSTRELDFKDRTYLCTEVEQAITGGYRVTCKTK